MSAWEQRKLGEVAEINPSSEIPDNFEYVDLESVVGTEMIAYRRENKKTAPSRAQRLAKKGDIFYQTVRPYQKNNYHFNLTRKDFVFSTGYAQLRPNINGDFLFVYIQLSNFVNEVLNRSTGTSYPAISPSNLIRMKVAIPTNNEQEKIGAFFKQLDSLIALHQRKPFIKNGGIKMITSNFTCDSLFKDYFEFWIKLYKEGAVRPVTLEKYRNNQKHIAKIIPNLKMKDFDRNAYQELLNQYALTHERQTVIDFHHQVKGAILDAVDDGLIDRDPTRKAIFKGKAPREKKQKYLNQFELHNLLEDLDLGMEITWDWLILLIAKTGLRFSEALGLTPADFDFARQTISVNKTWDYKTNTGFQPTKNRSSIRKVQMDWQLGMQFQHLIKNLNEDEPIFVNGPVCNSTPNNCLARHCRKCGIPEISIHGLRHTHASLLMFAGVSIASVSRRLGHSSITTTQKVYMHIISELENQDNDLVMRYLSSLS